MSQDAEPTLRVVPPPTVYFALFVIALVLDHFWPVRLLERGSRIWFGLGFIAASFFLILWVLREFRRVGTSFGFKYHANALVTGGPFRFSRNPGYLSLALAYLGIGLTAGSPWLVGMVVPAFVLTYLLAVLPEERYLETRFGEEYRHYRRAVRRWL